MWGEQERVKSHENVSKEKLQRKYKKKEKVFLWKSLCMTNLWNQLESKRYSNHIEKLQKRGLEKGGDLIQNETMSEDIIKHWHHLVSKLKKIKQQQWHMNKQQQRIGGSAVMSCKEGEGSAELNYNSHVTDHTEALL